MKFKSDIEIAQEAKMESIVNVARKIGLNGKDIELYGEYKAKISMDAVNRVQKNNKNGKLILVTAITPTPAGEGKTTTSVGLADGLSKLNKNVIVCLREPSLGPSFGVKGGAAGGGYSQIVPMEDINLHFTGDLHAVTYAHNLLAAMIDNSIQQGNPLNIDPRTIVFRRVIDLNDRSLRNTIIGLGGRLNGIPRESGFDITVASEIMAILCLANDLIDMKKRFSSIVIGYDYNKKPITVKELGAQGAMTVLMKDAIKPNLVQTLENTPAFVHGGPFANIAQGCNSVNATKTALKIADYVVTEAGFGADLGAEKFFNLKCRFAKLKPDVAVIVATVRALKMHGGLLKTELTSENLEALKKGFSNLEKHIENVKKFKVPVIVAINAFPSDTEKELKLLKELCNKININVSLSTVWADGGNGGIDLAKSLLKILETETSNFKLLYENNLNIKEKLNVVAKEIYGADGVDFTSEAEKLIIKYTELGYGNLPVCIAKTQYSFSDDQKKICRPKNFRITIREIRLAAGAGFLICIAGSIMTMPGLPKIPAACKIDIDEKGNITGLF